MSIRNALNSVALSDMLTTNSPQISSYDSVSYKDRYIVLMKDGKRLIRHDVILVGIVTMSSLNFEYSVFDLHGFAAQ